MDNYVNNRNIFIKIKYLMLLILAISFVVTAFIVGDLFYTKKWETCTLATVNGEPIIVKEIMPKLTAHRAEIYEYFNKKYNVVPEKDFWKNSFNGEVPEEKLKEAALDECINIKVQQILCRDNELIDDISYDGFLEDLRVENERRKNALKNKQVIYGPQKYTEDIYFSILLSNMTHNLKKKIDSQLIVSAEDIKLYYDAVVKKGIYKIPDKIKIEKIAVPFTFSDDIGKQVSKEKVEEIRMKFINGVSFSDLAKNYGEDTSIKVQFSEQIFDATTNRNDNRPSTYELTEKAKSLTVGQVSEVFLLNNVYYIVKCIEKKDEGFYGLNEVSESIKQALKEQRYIEYVENSVKRAEVVINQDVYKKLDIK